MFCSLPENIRILNTVHSNRGTFGPSWLDYWSSDLWNEGDELPERELEFTKFVVGVSVCVNVERGA